MSRFGSISGGSLHARRQIDQPPYYFKDSSPGVRLWRALCSPRPGARHFRPERRGVRMGIVAWIVLGLICGFIASLLVNHHGEGFFMDIVLGIIGAVVGGLIAHLA